ncbi:MAG: hypothetical protein WC637_00580 [Victivallales bacterium]|jgi:hypothetical protein
MAKKIPDAVMDLALANIADNGETLYLCSDEPANYAGIAAVSLGSVALTEGDGNGDFTIADGTTSGRKLTLAQQTVAGTANGTATHAVIADETGELIKAITTCSIAVLNGSNSIVDEYTVWEIRDPS